MKKEKQARDYYDQYSGNYDNFYTEIQFSKFRELASYFHGQKGGLVLDLGGGTALLSQYLNNKEINQSLVTLDLSYKMLETGLCNQTGNYIAADLSRIPVRSMVGLDLYSFTALQNLSLPDEGVAEINRIMDQQSKAILTILAKKITEAQFLEMMHKNMTKDQQIEIIRLITEDLACIINY